MPSREAVIKRVSKGGTRSVRQLYKQLGYLTRQSMPDRTNIALMGSARHQNDPDNPGHPIANAVDPNNLRAFARHVYQRSGRLPGDQPNARLSHDLTLHFVISFPRGTDFGAAERTGRDWAEYVFGHGYHTAQHGTRRYDYITAFHRHEGDEGHPHMHVVVDRSPVGGGNLLRIERGHPHFSYEAMRLAAVEAAANHNVMLTVTLPEERTEMVRPITNAEFQRRRRDAGRLAYADSHYDEHDYGPEDDDGDDGDDDNGGDEAQGNGGPANRDRGDRTSRDLARGCTPDGDPLDDDDALDFSDDGGGAMDLDGGNDDDANVEGVPFEDDQAALDRQLAADIEHRNPTPSQAGRDGDADMDDPPSDDDQAALDRQLAADIEHRNQAETLRIRTPSPADRDDNADLYDVSSEDEQAAHVRRRNQRARADNRTPSQAGRHGDADMDDPRSDDDQAALDRQLAADIEHRNQAETLRMRTPSPADREDNDDLYDASSEDEQAADVRRRDQRAIRQNPSPRPQAQADREIDPLETQSREPFELDDDDDDDDAPHAEDQGTDRQAEAERQAAADRQAVADRQAAIDRQAAADRKAAAERVLRVQPDRDVKRKRPTDGPADDGSQRAGKRLRTEPATVQDGDPGLATRSTAPAADTRSPTRKRRHADDRRENASKRARTAGLRAATEAPTWAPEPAGAGTAARVSRPPQAGTNPGANAGSGSQAQAIGTARRPTGGGIAVAGGSQPAPAVAFTAGRSGGRADGARQQPDPRGPDPSGKTAGGAGRVGNTTAMRREAAAAQRQQALEALQAHRRLADADPAPSTARQDPTFRERDRELLRLARQALNEERRANHGNTNVTTRAAQRARNAGQPLPAADPAAAPGNHNPQPPAPRERRSRPGRGED